MLPIKVNKISMAMLVIVSVVYIEIFLFAPSLFSLSLSMWSGFFMFFLPFIVAVIGLIGLFDAYIPAEYVAKHLGKESKPYAYFLAAFLGILATASEYAVFPTIAMLRRKGAKSSVLAVFLVAWSGVSFPVMPLEIEIFGARFALFRIGLIVAGALAIGLFTKFLGVDIKTSD